MDSIETKLASHHVTVNYLLLAVLALVIAVMSTGGYIALKIFDARLAAAEKQEQVYVQTLQSYQQQLANDSAQRAQLQAQIDNLTHRIVNRDTSAEKKISDIVKISTPKEATDALNSAYGFTFDPTSVPQLNLLTTTKIEHDQFKADVTDYKQIVSGDNKQIVSLEGDLAAANKTLGECQKTVEGYKKAAKSSKFKKVLHGAEVAAIAIGSFYLGHKLL